MNFILGVLAIFFIIGIVKKVKFLIKFAFLLGVVALFYILKSSLG